MILNKFDFERIIKVKEFDSTDNTASINTDKVVEVRLINNMRKGNYSYMVYSVARKMTMNIYTEKYVHEPEDKEDVYYSIYVQIFNGKKMEEDIELVVGTETTHAIMASQLLAKHARVYGLSVVDIPTLVEQVLYCTFNK